MARLRKGKITLLRPFHLKNGQYLKEFDFWSKLSKWIPGWHYDIDMSWALDCIEKMNLKKGSRILDAGGGLGIFQYILASRGYNVYSVDFSKRKIPNFAKKNFVIFKKKIKSDYSHSYQNFINLNSISIHKYIGFKNIVKINKIYYRIKREFNSILMKFSNNAYINRNNSGSITFIEAAFHEMPFGNKYFDAVVSISALEHSDIHMLEQNLHSLINVSKSKNSVFISTSATMDQNNLFDNKTAGWCFSKSTLSKYLDNVDVEFNSFSQCEHEIKISKLIKSRIDSYYFTDPTSPFYKKKVKKLPYIPIGLTF